MSEKQLTDGLFYRISPQISNSDLNALYNAAWQDDARRDFEPVLKRSLAFICAYRENFMIGFVNLAWDGGLHAFILDTLVHPQFRRRGIGRELVRQAAEEAKRHRVEWLHVDFEPHLQIFYDGCGFRKTAAGLMNLKSLNEDK